MLNLYTLNFCPIDVAFFHFKYRGQQVISTMIINLTGEFYCLNGKNL